MSENEKKSNQTFKGKIDDDFLSNIPNKIGFTIKDIKTNVGHKTDLKSYTKLWFIHKLRNGIAHQNIEGINESDKWIGLKLWNTNNDLVDFEVIFTIEEIKQLALKIADDYLISIKNKIKENQSLTRGIANKGFIGMRRFVGRFNISCNLIENRPQSLTRNTPSRWWLF
ncbi:MAG: hypothetical protein FD143_1447 [Ignavibacteria bacterium]|nr:MAG: hypothetical protein FD143_1447 [Ignavibacteria bacterium]KAF0160498.1 MAG: hypothetical protein FD188_1672 [Ignavibacteria bacterium]